MILWSVVGYAQELNITSPVSSEETVWVGGTTQDILWSGGTTDSVKISFLDETGNTVIADSTFNDGQFSWLVTDGLTRTCRIVIAGSEADTAEFTRENSAGGIYIQRPSFDEYWRRGTSNDISWTDNLDEDLKIILYEYPGEGMGEPTTSLLDITLSTPSSGTYSWTIPGNIDPGEYQLRLEGVDHPMTYVYSDKFNIVLSPTGCADESEPYNSLEHSYPYAFSGSIGSPDSFNDSIEGTFHEVNDDDFYTITIDTPGTLNIDLSNVHDDANLVLYTWNGASYVAIGSSSGMGDENINIHIDDVNKDYYIGVEGPDASTVCGPYTLLVEWTADVCMDVFEPNDVFENPSVNAFSPEIGGTYSKTESIEGTIHQSGDWDHYLITAQVEGNLNIDLTTVPDEFDLQLYDGSEVFLASSETTGDENINYDITQPGDYVIIVGSLTGAFDCTPYMLSLDWTTQECTDIYEPNDSIEAPDTIAFSAAIGGIYSQNESIQGTIHKPGDWDHYRIITQVPGALDLDLTNVPDDVDLQLYDSAGVYLEGSFRPGDEHIRIDLAEANYYYIIVGSLTGVFDCSLYTLDVEWFPDNCEDPFEPNDQIESPDSSAFSQDIGGIFTSSESIQGSIHQSGDYDHYLIKAVIPGLLEIDLTDVQSKIDLQLYDSNGYLAGSFTSGDEHIGYVVADTGSYIVIVGSDEGVFDCSPYTLAINWTVDQFLLVTPESAQVSSLGDTVVFEVLSNVGWSASVDSSWLSIISQQIDELRVSVQKNTHLQGRSGNLTVIADGVDTIVAQVTQYPGECDQNLVPDSIFAGADSGTTSILVEFNDAWTVNDTVDWVSTSVSGDTIIVTYDANGTTEVRMAWIEVSGGECSGSVPITQEAGDCHLTIVEDTLEFIPTGGSEQIAVTTNTEWIVSEFSNWITTSSSGDTLTIQCSENATTQSRTAQLTALGGECTDTLQIIQQGADCYLAVIPDSLTVGPGSGSSSFAVESNENWSVFNDAEWLTITLLEDTIQISYGANGTINDRTAILSITGGECMLDVKVVQQGLEPLLEVDVTEILLGPDAGSSGTFNITSNTDWLITEDISWLGVEVILGSGSKEVAILATGTNNTGQPRSDTIHLSGAGVAYQIVVTQETTTGVQSSSASRFVLYPNPASSELTVKLNSQIEDFTVRIHSSLGRIVLVDRYQNTTEFDIDLKGLPGGIYLLELIDGERRAVRTFIKK